MSGKFYSRRGFIGLTAAAGAGLGLSACTGAAPSTSGTGSSAPAPTSNELRVFTYEDNATIDLLKAQIKIFDEQAGTVTTVDSLPGSGAAVYPDKLRTELLGGSGPDVWRIWGGQIGAPYVKAKQAMDLSPYYEKFGWDARINEAAVAGMTFDGVKGGVPYIALGVGGWYNKAAFEKAGVGGPRRATPSWRRRTTRSWPPASPRWPPRASTAGTSCGSMSTCSSTPRGRSCTTSCSSVRRAGTAPRWSTSFTLFKKWQDQKWIPDGALGLDPADVEPWYVQGKAAYTITGPWTETNAIQSAKKDSADFGNFEFPTDQSTARHSGFVEGYMINAKTGNPDKSAELIDFIVKPETQKELKISASTVAGAEPDEKDPAAVLRVVAGSG